MSEKPLKKAIDQLLRAYGYQNQLDEIELLKIYESQVGKMFVNHTKDVYYKDKTLVIHLDSSSLKQELSYVKEGLMQKLNQRMGKTMVEKIIIK
jgi:predicted nucleic acid-binding Zn ribbon protein